MKDVSSFFKLLDLNIPDIDHFDYYVGQLSKTKKFSNIRYLISLFEDVESHIPDIGTYKVSKTNEIVDFIKNTNAYMEMCYDSSLMEFPTAKSFQYEEGINYFSIDLRSSNWQALKAYDPPHMNELGPDYSTFLRRFGMPEIFVHSKYLRQFIFGSVDPKRISKIQRALMQQMIRSLQDSLQVEFARNDEVVFSFKDRKEIDDIISKIDRDRFKYKIFNIRRVEDFRIDSIECEDGSYDEMVGVNMNQFYWKLKQYITREPLDIRDLIFRSDGKKAIWFVDDLKSELNIR